MSGEGARERGSGRGASGWAFPERRPLPAEACLAPGATLAEALRALVTTTSPVLVAGNAAVPAMAVRAAHRAGLDGELLLEVYGTSAWPDQARAGGRDGVGPAAGAAPLARTLLFAASEGEARRRLADEPDLPGLLVPREGGAVGARGALDLLAPRVEPIRAAVVMAGGLGSRLRPLTDHTPKPLLEVGGDVLLFRILRSLAEHGVRRAYLSVRHMADQVRRAVGDGARFGLEVRYLEEQRPLGTGAGLAMLGALDEPFFVVNGDLLTNLCFGALGREHVTSGRLATIVTHMHAMDCPFGVVRATGGVVARIDEKPVLRHPINAGIYAFSPGALAFVEPGERLEMVDFLNDTLAPRGEVGEFPLVEYWNDVGTPMSFERAQLDAPLL